jgi:hypothetical protein
MVATSNPHIKMRADSAPSVRIISDKWKLSKPLKLSALNSKAGFTVTNAVLPKSKPKNGKISAIENRLNIIEKILKNTLSAAKPL